MKGLLPFPDKLVSTSTGWPKPEREGLLHAALGDYAEAIPAWESFLREEGLGALDDDALELLPQVYRNLLHHEYAGPAMRPLREIADEAGGRQEARWEEMRPWIRHLHQLNIPTIVLPGATCTLLVRPRDMGRARELFTLQGWRAIAGLPTALTATQQRYGHAIELASPSGQILNLRWHLLPQSRGPRADEGFWKRAWPAGQDMVLRLPPTDQLLGICAQGDSAGLWVCQAMMAIRSGKIDWELLLKLARQHDVMLPLGDALRYLRESFHAPVPRSVIWRLRSSRAGRFARMEYGLLATYRDYGRGVRDWPWLRRLLGFPAYLAFSLRLGSTRQTR